MTTAAYYRQEAKRQRELATAEPNPELADQLRSFARDYDILAAILEAGENMPPSPPKKENDK